MNKIKKTLAWIGMITALLFCLITLVYLIVHDRERLLSVVIAVPISIMFIWSIEEVMK